MSEPVMPGGADITSRSTAWPQAKSVAGQRPYRWPTRCAAALTALAIKLVDELVDDLRES